MSRQVFQEYMESIKKSKYSKRIKKILHDEKKDKIAVEEKISVHWENDPKVLVESD
jgi:hypothetical protein